MKYHFSGIATFLAWTAVVLWLGVVPACGDDEPTSTDSDVTDISDTRPDQEVTEDPIEEQGDPVEEQGDPVEEPDAEEEEVVPLTETDCSNGFDDDGDTLVDCDDVDDCVCETCNNLMDDDSDELVDCDDPDCTDDPVCPEICNDQMDNDANGDVDCDDAECSETLRCQEEPVTPDAYVFSDNLSYFYNLQYPPTGVACCFDMNGDDEPDNQLMQVLGGIPEYDPQLEMYASINMGSVLLLVEWTEITEDLGTATATDADFNIFRGVPILPAPPQYLEEPIGPETNLWADGRGVFQITRDSFDERGPAIRFEGAQVQENMLTGGPHFIRLMLPMDALGIDLRVTLYQARISAQLEEVEVDGTPQIHTVPQEVTVGDETITVGGGMLGGSVRADDILAFLNLAAGQCGCSTPSGETRPLLAYGEQPAPNQGYLAACNWTPLVSGDGGYTCTTADSSMCPQLTAICGLAGLIPYILDVDANLNEIDESLSAGLYFDLTGARLTNPHVTPE